MIEDWQWDYYAVTMDNRLVMGFNDEKEVKKYCKKNHFKVFTKNGLKNKKIKANDINFWVYDNEVPAFC